MIFCTALSAASAATPVKSWPLDDRTAYAIRLGTDAPTTIAFPGSVSALEGANVSARAEDNPAVLLSHQPGSSFFSLRALRPEATGAINVIHRGKIIALTFTTGTDPDRAITFREQGEPATAKPKGGALPSRWLSLLDQARRHAVIAEQFPALAAHIERRTPGTVNESAGLSVTVEEVFRFAADDALVFRVRLENSATQAVRYTPARLAMRVAQTLFPVALTDADGVVNAHSASTVWLVVARSADDARPGLSLENTFSVEVPRLP